MSNSLSKTSPGEELSVLRDLQEENVDLEQSQQALTRMQGAIERFKKTIDNLTDITKLHKAFAGEVVSVDIPRVEAEVLLDLEPLIQAAGARIETDLSRCEALSFSEKNLRSIVYNLLSNAIKYHAPERPPVVLVSCHQEAEFLVLVVKDNGLGLRAEQQKQLFGMFCRFHDHVEGSGIGLYMVKRIVENAGGRIEVSSMVGEGTTFSIYLKRS